MRDAEEFEKLLGEIPHAVSSSISSINHDYRHRRGGDGGGGGDHHDISSTTQNSNAITYDRCFYGDDTFVNNNTTCASPAIGFCPQSDTSSTSSLFSGGYPLSDNGSTATPPLEESKPYSIFGPASYPNSLQMNFNAPEYSAVPAANENVSDEFSLSRKLDRLLIGNEINDAQLGLNGCQFFDHFRNGTRRLDVEQHRLRDNYNGVTPGVVGFQHQYALSNLLRSPYSFSPGQANELFPQIYSGNVAMNSHFGLEKGNMFGVPTSRSIAEEMLWIQKNSGSVYTENGAIGMANMTRTSSVPNIENLLGYLQPLATAHNRFLPHVRAPHMSFGEDGLIIPGDSLNYVVKSGYGCSKGNINKGSSYVAGMSAFQERRSLFGAPIARIQESPRRSYPLALPCRHQSLAEIRGSIYHFSKDQNGCRFLQKIFDEGIPQDVQIIFDEIIDHVVELMVDPFGNYLMQKLLEVSNEEQRADILVRVTASSGELIRISLNTHGTRVVQKLIETLRTKKQTQLFISALEPGFLLLIKDLNGNHVIQRCLVCLSNEDNEFIFVAAAKYCFQIATHQHGCCVLQRCIGFSTEEHRENLIAEISANGLLLAQDAYGNYVVQFILDQKIPSATTKLLSLFDGHYANLSTQKFSSHVVEKCLVVCNEAARAKIIYELLSTSHFEQLLQDPHANYVVQTALKVSEGRVHNMLVDAIESHKAISRNSPYSKRIFSNKLLKK